MKIGSFFSKIPNSLLKLPRIQHGFLITAIDLIRASRKPHFRQNLHRLAHVWRSFVDLKNFFMGIHHLQINLFVDLQINYFYENSSRFLFI